MKRSMQGGLEQEALVDTKQTREAHLQALRGDRPAKLLVACALKVGAS